MKAPVVRLGLLVVAAAASLAMGTFHGAKPAPEPTAVDACLLEEYLRECGFESETPEETAACRNQAHKGAVRMLAGIPHRCRPGV